MSEEEKEKEKKEEKKPKPKEETPAQSAQQGAPKPEPSPAASQAPPAPKPEVAAPPAQQSVKPPALTPTAGTVAPAPKPTPEAVPPRPAATAAPARPPTTAGAPLPPRPTAAPAARPPSAVPAGRPPSIAPPSRLPQKQGRRGFIKLLAVVGVVLSLAPFVPFGEFLSASIKGSGKLARQKIVVDNNPTLYKNAAGKAVNVNDLNTFPPNWHWVITYPSSGDSTLDAQNSDTFTKFELIRLPAELGGDKADASSFVAFSKVCVHLWCSPNYGGGPDQNPAPEHRDYECPCHGSLYSVGEPIEVNGTKVKPPVGVAIAGPAAVQPAPTNAIPMLTLSTDKDGSLHIEPPIWDVNRNGVLGFGRAVQGAAGE